MAKTVVLDEIVSEVCGVMFGSRVLLNRRTGEVEPYCDEWDLTAEDRARYESEDWLEVPYPDEDSDWRIMRDFAGAQTDEGVRERLWDALNRSRPFRRFRDELERLGLRDAWYPYYEQGMRRYVSGWLEVNGIAFTDGVTA